MLRKPMEILRKTVGMLRKPMEIVMFIGVKLKRFGSQWVGRGGLGQVVVVAADPAPTPARPVQ